MTREEAINMLKAKRTCIERETSGVDKMCSSGRCMDCPLNYEQGNLGEQKETLDVAIKALEQEPCDDAISRQAMHIELEKWITYGEYKYSNAMKYLYDRIDRLPPVTSKPKTGHWIIKEGREQGYDIAGIKTWYIQIMCDKCGFIKTAIEGHTGQYHFCPNCGAKMESEDKE